MLPICISPSNPKLDPSITYSRCIGLSAGSCGSAFLPNNLFLRKCFF